MTLITLGRYQGIRTSCYVTVGHVGSPHSCFLDPARFCTWQLVNVRKRNTRHMTFALKCDIRRNLAKLRFLKNSKTGAESREQCQTWIKVNFVPSLSPAEACSHSAQSHRNKNPGPRKVSLQKQLAELFVDHEKLHPSECTAFYHTGHPQ